MTPCEFDGGQTEAFRLFTALQQHIENAQVFAEMVQRSRNCDPESRNKLLLGPLRDFEADLLNLRGVVVEVHGNLFSESTSHVGKPPSFKCLSPCATSPLQRRASLANTSPSKADCSSGNATGSASSPRVPYTSPSPMVKPKSPRRPELLEFVGSLLRRKRRALARDLGDEDGKRLQELDEDISRVDEELALARLPIAVDHDVGTRRRGSEGSQSPHGTRKISARVSGADVLQAESDTLTGESTEVKVGASNIEGLMPDGENSPRDVASDAENSSMSGRGKNQKILATALPDDDFSYDMADSPGVFFQNLSVDTTATDMGHASEDKTAIVPMRLANERCDLITDDQCDSSPTVRRDPALAPLDKSHLQRWSQESVDMLIGSACCLSEEISRQPPAGAFERLNARNGAKFETGGNGGLSDSWEDGVGITVRTSAAPLWAESVWVPAGCVPAGLLESVDLEACPRPVVDRSIDSMVQPLEKENIKPQTYADETPKSATVGAVACFTSPASAPVQTPPDYKFPSSCVTPVRAQAGILSSPGSGATMYFSPPTTASLHPEVPAVVSQAKGCPVPEASSSPSKVDGANFSEVARLPQAAQLKTVAAQGSAGKISEGIAPALAPEKPQRSSCARRGGTPLLLKSPSPVRVHHSLHSPSAPLLAPSPGTAGFRQAAARSSSLGSKSGDTPRNMTNWRRSLSFARSNRQDDGRGSRGASSTGTSQSSLFSLPASAAIGSPSSYQAALAGIRQASQPWR